MTNWVILLSVLRTHLWMKHFSEAIKKKSDLKVPFRPLLISLKEGQTVRDVLIDSPSWFIPKRLNRTPVSTWTPNDPHASPTLFQLIQRSKEWKRQIESGVAITQIAQSVDVKTKRVEELLWLALLPRVVVKRIEKGRGDEAEWSINQAIREARRFVKLTELREVLSKVDRWQEEIESGVSRASIGRREGLSRARMTQLMRLTLVPLEIRTRIFVDPFVGRIPSIWELIQRI